MSCDFLDHVMKSHFTFFESLLNRENTFTFSDYFEAKHHLVFKKLIKEGSLNADKPVGC